MGRNGMRDDENKRNKIQSNANLRKGDEVRRSESAANG